MSEAPTTTSRPDVSVIVVVYNDRDRLIDCLRSLEGQTLRSLMTEIIY